MESMSVASECGCKDIDFLILLIPIPLVSALFGSSIPSLLFAHFVKRVLFLFIFCTIFK